MWKRIISAFFLISILIINLFVPVSSAAKATYDSMLTDYVSDFKVIPVEKNNKWGFVDQNGKLVVPCRYEGIRNLFDGHLSVKLNNKWGVTDINGKLVVQCKYDGVYNLFNGFFKVYLNNKMGVIDRNGKLILDTIYDGMNYQGGLFIAYDGTKNLYFDMNGNEIDKKYLGYNEYYLMNSNYIVGMKMSKDNYFNWGIIDKSTGKETTFPKLATYVYGMPLCPVLINENGLFGFIQNFKKNPEDKDDIKGGIIDKNGKIVLPFEYECYGHSPGIVGFDPYFSDGLSLVQNVKTGKTSYIDKNGKIVFTLSKPQPVSFYYGLEHQPFNFHEGMCRIISGVKEKWPDITSAEVINYTGKWGFIDKSGKTVVPMQYDKVSDFYNGYAAVKKNGKMGFINKQGKVVVPIIYDCNSPLNNGDYSVITEYYKNMKNGTVTVAKKGKYGLIDYSGKTLIPFIYAGPIVYNSENGLFFVKKDGKYGFTDKNNRIVVPIKYQDATPFIKNISFVKYANHYGAIDKSGKSIVPIQYDFITYEYNNSKIVAYKNGIYYIFNLTGKQLFTAASATYTEP